MINIFFDIESTGTNPYTAEIIEANFQEYIDGVKTREYDYRARVDFWSEDAEKIHKIKEYETLGYNAKREALEKLVSWLPKEFTFLTYANKNTELGVINYDVACLENELNLSGYKNYFLKNAKKMKAPISVHTIAKECARKLLFAPILGKEAYRLGIVRNESAKASNRQSFAQGSVYYALFGELPPSSHRAKIDVDCLVRIYNELVSLQNETKSLI